MIYLRNHLIWQGWEYVMSMTTLSMKMVPSSSNGKCYLSWFEISPLRILLTVEPWCSISYMPSDHSGRFNSPQQWQFSNSFSQLVVPRRRIGGAVLDSNTLRSLEDRRALFFPLSLLLRNARPVGHHVNFLNLLHNHLSFLVALLFLTIQNSPRR